MIFLIIFSKLTHISHNYILYKIWYFCIKKKLCKINLLRVQSKKCINRNTSIKIRFKSAVTVRLYEHTFIFWEFKLIFLLNFRRLCVVKNNNALVLDNIIFIRNFYRGLKNYAYKNLIPHYLHATPYFLTTLNVLSI